VPLELLNVVLVLVGFQPTLHMMTVSSVLQEHSLMVVEQDAKIVLMVPIPQTKLALVLLAVLVTALILRMMVVLHVPREPFQQLVCVKIAPQELSPPPPDQPLAKLAVVVYKSIQAEQIVNTVPLDLSPLLNHNVISVLETLCPLLLVLALALSVVLVTRPTQLTQHVLNVPLELIPMITHLANLAPTALLQRELVQHLVILVLAVSKM